jgi:transposase-like protein
MRQAGKRIPESAEKTVRDIRKATPRHHSAEEKIRIVLEGLRDKVSIAELCRKEGINQNLYYRWPKEFLRPARSGWLATRPPRLILPVAAISRRGHPPPGMKRPARDRSERRRAELARPRKGIRCTGKRPCSRSARPS